MPMKSREFSMSAVKIRRSLRAFFSSSFARSDTSSARAVRWLARRRWSWNTPNTTPVVKNTAPARYWPGSLAKEYAGGERNHSTAAVDTAEATTATRSPPSQELRKTAG